jgi:NAD(P)-dependent dehydrogenase (short-subunit alcohol dehydrogenase family)
MGKRFLELGAQLIICGRRADMLKQTADEFAELGKGVKVETYTCDLRDTHAVESMMNDIWEAGPIDVLVNNAAANFIAQTHNLSTRAVDAVLDTTLHGTLYMTMAAGKRWIASKRPGVVLTILSTSVVTGRAFTTASAMAKSGLLAMTRSLAVEWGPRNIRLVAIGPGRFPTAGAYERLRPASRQAETGDGAKEIPLGRVGKHSELSDLATFLISGGAAYITGEMVIIDGGQHLRSSGSEELLAWSDKQWAEHASRRN